MTISVTESRMGIPEMGKSKEPLIRDAALVDPLVEFGVHLGARTISLVGEINEAQLRRFSSAIDLLESESSGSIVVNLSSTGGSVDPAWAIVSRITSSPCQITVNGHGYIASAATLILACADYRTMSAYSWFLHHETMYTLPELTRAREIEHTSRIHMQERKAWAAAMAKWTKKPATFWETEGQKGCDLVIGAQTCLKYGIIDKIL